MTNVHTEGVLWCFYKEQVICTLLQSLRADAHFCRLVFSDEKNIIISQARTHRGRSFQWIVRLTGPWKQLDSWGAWSQHWEVCRVLCKLGEIARGVPSRASGSPGWTLTSGRQSSWDWFRKFWPTMKSITLPRMVLHNRMSRMHSGLPNILLEGYVDLTYGVSQGFLRLVDT